MKIYFDKRVRVVFSMTLIVLTVLGVFSFTSMQRLIQTARLLSHASRVINNAELVVKSCVDIETGQRGYVITANENFLEPFHESSGIIENYLDNLDSLTTDNVSQKNKVDTLRLLVRAQLRWTEKVIDSRKESFEKAQALVVEGTGKQITDSIRACVGRIQREERDIFASGNTISRESLQQFQYSFVGLAVLIIAIILYLFYILNRSLRSRNQVEATLKNVAAETRDLYDHAPCGYLSVDNNIFLSNINKTLLDWLGYTEQEVIGKMKFEDLLTAESKKTFLKSFDEDFDRYKKNGVVNDLEFDFQRKDGTSLPVLVNSAAIFNDHGEFVKSRSTVSDNSERKKAQTKILDLNKELEGFTYSVSHDLRAPLRSIVGYATILKEEHADKLDEEATRITDVIIRNTIRMGQLIDDLLDFSRLGRKSLVFTDINMKETVEHIVREQVAELKNRKLSITVLDMENAKGDVAMIRQVWVNLISNALKYTSKKDVSVIEVGSFKEKGKKIYYIRDNGAGFDMKYADKLFGVFQRLHKMNEFEGTGVGLALVKTIIKRHEGNAWAEGKPNEGAKFYFSLN